MKRENFNIKRVVVLLLVMFPLLSIAEEEKKIHRFLPNYVKIQYAGDIACISIGAGYSYSKNRWETEMLLGYVPKELNDRGFVTFTLKQNYIPWSVDIGKKKEFVFIPFTCALAVNIVLDSDFGLTNKDRYTDGYNYYGFDPSVHLHLMLGQRISIINPIYKKKKGYITFYYELGSNDLTILNAVKNSSLRPRDYLNLGIGLIFTI